MKRALVVTAAVVVALPVAGIAVASWWLGGDGIKLRLAEQVRRSTGRDLTIAGPVSIAWSFTPTLALNDVSLGNPPGFSTPTMAHVDRVEAQVSLGALFRRQVVVDRVAIRSPSVRLERDGAGRPNWDFSPPPAPSQTPATPSDPAGPRFSVAIGTVDVTDAMVAWGLQTVSAPRLSYRPDTASLDGTIVAAGQTLTLTGTAGSPQNAPAPLDLRLAGPGVTATLHGTSAAATVRIEAADLSTLSPLAGRALPVIRDVSLSATWPGPGTIQLRTGAAAFGALTLQAGTLDAPSLTDPATVTAQASIGALPLAIRGTVGSVAGLLRGPVPVDATVEAPRLRLTASGTVAATGAGTLQLGLATPDLAAVGAEAGLGLPVLHDVQLTATTAIAPGSVAVRGLQLSSAQGDLSGDVTLTVAGRPALRGALSSTRFTIPATTAPLPAPIASAGPAAPVTAPAPARLVPDTRLPLAFLRSADADLTLSVGTLSWGNATFTNVSLPVTLAAGVMRTEPAATVGAAPAHATIRLDAAAQPSTVQATVDAPGLPFRAVLALHGGDATAPGTLDLRADLSGRGDTWHELAATLSGHFGLAVVDGQLDNAWLERFAVGPLRGAGLSLEGGTTIRCAAIRADAEAGRIQFRTLALDTSKFSLEGGGDLDMGTEALDLHLRPQLRLGGGLSVPIRLRGTLAAPKATLDPGALASGRVGFMLGGAPPPDTCGPALAAARDGQAGVPAAAAPPPRPLKPADLLRGLLR